MIDAHHFAAHLDAEVAQRFPDLHNSLPGHRPRRNRDPHLPASNNTPTGAHHLPHYHIALNRGRSRHISRLRRNRPYSRRLGHARRIRPAVDAPAGHDLGIDIEQTPVNIQQGLLVSYQMVAPGDVLLSWRAIEHSGLSRPARRLPIDAPAGNDLGVDAEQAAVHIQQRLLIGDELIAHRDIPQGDRLLGGHRRRHNS